MALAAERVESLTPFRGGFADEAGDFDAGRGMDQLVVLDIEGGGEVARVDTGSPVQSVLFPAAGFDGELYLCTFTTVSRIAARAG